MVELPLLDALGLAMAKPIIARSDSPRFDASAVDGYAVSLADFVDGTPVTLPVGGTTHAGSTSIRPLRSGTTQRIFTGGSVPKGADAVVMQEQVSVADEAVTVHSVPKSGVNIRKRGAEVRRGDSLFDAGTIITPSVAQTCAASGYPLVKAHARPTISVIVTGDELKTPGSKLSHGEIWDSNTTALNAVLGILGIKNIHIRQISDSPTRTANAVRAALERSDVVIATGGVSVGDRDYVKEAFASNGVEEIFWGVSIRPGKPIYFGVKRRKGVTNYVFGLPGNPVSVMATYLLFVRPAILRVMGHAEKENRQRGMLAMQIKKSDPRMEFIRAYREDESGGLPSVFPLSGRESHMTTGMAKADCFLIVPAEQVSIEAGTEIEFLPIKWAPY